jgi:thiol-disulfide isomerase/thioredoxin
MKTGLGRARYLGVVLGAVVLSAMPTQATVGAIPGEKAPAIVASRWLRGAPVDQFAPGSVYAVDFWSTWCKPCIAAMPQVKALEDKYRGSLVVISMNVWEPTPAKVPEFVATHLEQLPSFVAMDSVPPGKEANLGLTVAAYLGTSDLNSIPRIYLVGKDGRVAWIGPPADIEGPLSDIMNDKWDLEAFALTYKQRLADQQRLQDALARIGEALAKSDWEEAIRLCEDSAASQPQMASQIARGGFMRAAIKMLGAESPGSVEIENGLRAMDRSLELLVTPDWRLCMQCAQLAESVGRVPKALDYLGQALQHAPPEERARIESELKRLRGD